MTIILSLKTEKKELVIIMRTILTILFIPFVAIFEIIRGVVGGILGLYDGFKSISGGNKLTPEKLAYYKKQSHKAAQVLNADTNKEKVLKMIGKLLDE